jgi:hypothetical protein
MTFAPDGGHLLSFAIDPQRVAAPPSGAFLATWKPQ